MTAETPTIFVFAGAADSFDAGAAWPNVFGWRFTPRERTPCRECGKLSVVGVMGEALDAEVMKGRRWFDVIRVVPNALYYLISQRVVDSLTRGKVTGFLAHPVDFVKIKPKSLQAVPVPYYWLEITGRAALDLKLHRWPELKCRACGQFGAPDPVPSGPEYFVPDLATWDGSDLFVRGLEHNAFYPWCTRKVVELARQDGWTNARFHPASLESATSWSIDLTGPWPPQWYPADYNGPVL